MKKDILICKMHKGKLITSYTSYAEASKATGLKVNKIRDVCNGKSKMTGGFKWVRRKANPIPLHKANPKDVDLAIRANCAMCSGQDDDDIFLSDEVFQEIKYCPCKCYIKDFRPYKNKEY